MVEGFKEDREDFHKNNGMGTVYKTLLDGMRCKDGLNGCWERVGIRTQEL